MFAHEGAPEPALEGEPAGAAGAADATEEAP